MKIKASDFIRLTDGRRMTLREALDGELVVKKHWPTYNRKSGVPVDRYVAKETNGDLYWEIGKTLFDGRFVPKGSSK